MSERILRPCKPADREAIARIADDAWEGIRASQRKVLGDELYAILNPDGERRKGNELRRQCDNDPATLWVCEEAGAVVGFITLRLDPATRIGAIGNNAVARAVAGKGIGQEMYRMAFDYFKAHGMAYASVCTGLDEGHAPARRAYERAGFSIRLESVRYYRKLD